MQNQMANRLKSGAEISTNNLNELNRTVSRSKANQLMGDINGNFFIDGVTNKLNLNS